MWRKILNSFNSIKCSVHNPNVLAYNNGTRYLSTLVAGEPEGPVVKTAIPGPRSLAMLSEMKTIQVSSKIILHPSARLFDYLILFVLDFRCGAIVRRLFQEHRQLFV